MASDNISADSTQKFNVAGLEAIIFDFDGTLVDSEPVWKSSFVELFRRDYNTELSQDVLWANTANGVDRSVTNIAEHYHLDFSSEQVRDMTDAINKETHRKIIEELPLRPGAIELFDWARDRDITLAVCTASTHELISTYLEKHNVISYFSEITSTVGVDFEKRKPHPHSYLTAMEAINVSADHAIAIEDAPAGVQSAMAAGLPTIAIHNPFIEERVAALNPMAQVQDFHQVLALLVSEL